MVQSTETPIIRPAKWAGRFLSVGVDFRLLRTRRLMDMEAHPVVFLWVLQVQAEKNLFRGTALGGRPNPAIHGQ